ncbi:pentatricopeptide repeat-containing protein At2g15690, mitochondrial-like isoform X2 [Argentina anserina]|uniref:pentatricopeptide repeat-containing protein At2g15690, mitochondrial-like isoform X2 n=1 Tax=Argentina anserina TaxID=57926 RepID=UPI0021766AE4|nr:pentatricopeptide repeat-containing protein At2g15690, mitochondrial-like isoform X2 [Potentilla anserina]
MWRRLVPSSPGRRQAFGSAPCRSTRPFLNYSASSLAVEPFQGSFTLSSFHASIAFSSRPAFAINHEYDQVQSDLEGRNNTLGQNADYSGLHSQNIKWSFMEIPHYHWNFIQDPIQIHPDRLKALRQSSDQFRQNYGGGFKGSTDTEIVNNPVQQSENFSRFCGPENGRLQQTTQQNSYVAHQEKPRELVQMPHGFKSQSSSGSPGSINHNYMQHSAEYQQNTVDYNVRSISAQNQILSDCYRNNALHQPSVDTRRYQQSPQVGQYHQRLQFEQYQQSPQVGHYHQRPQFGHYHQRLQFKQYQQSPQVGHYHQSPQVGQYQKSFQVRQYQRYPQFRQYEQSPQVRQYEQSPHVRQYEQSPHVRQYEQIPQSGQYQKIPQVGQYQQSPHVRQYEKSPQIGQYQQIPQVGQYQQCPRGGEPTEASDSDPNSVKGTFEKLDLFCKEGNVKEAMEVGQYQQSPQGGEPAEASDSDPTSVKGTLEELDLFCKEGEVKEALKVLDMLQRQDVHVNLDRYIQLMDACGEAKALEEAKSVHENMKLLSPLEVSTYNRILEMYSKCGSMEDASMVFDNMPKRNLTSWDIMITWSAKNGHGEDAIDLFTQFKEAGLKPDGQMFIGVFYACSIVGDANEGLLHFKSMRKDYGIVPTTDHYVSVVDMLGSIGLLDEALEFIEKMTLEPNVDVWKTLMHYCRVHGFLELGDRCAELVDQLNPSCLNEQAKAGLIPVSESDLVKKKEKKQIAAKNLLEVRSRVHEYRAGDRSHPDNEKFYSLLRGLREQMKEAGYIPETRFVLHDIDQEGKEDALLSHSERLAVADGLLASSARSPIRVIKNLRVCGDCHSALKIISKIVADKADGYVVQYDHLVE